jgi:hypothetical protein
MRLRTKIEIFLVAIVLTLFLFGYEIIVNVMP